MPLAVWRAALKTILLTGQRPGEVAAMRREHIVDDGWWELPGEPVAKLGWPGTKNGASHRVWLPRFVQELIGNETTGFVFSRSRPMHARCHDARHLQEARRRSRRTTLRRTHGSTITALGFGRDAMNRIQNHRRVASPASTTATNTR